MIMVSYRALFSFISRVHASLIHHIECIFFIHADSITCSSIHMKLTGYLLEYLNCNFHYEQSRVPVTSLCPQFSIFNVHFNLNVYKIHKEQLPTYFENVCVFSYLEYLSRYLKFGRYILITQIGTTCFLKKVVNFCVYIPMLISQHFDLLGDLN